MKKLIKKLEYGFRSYTGVVLPNVQVDRLNKLIDRKNAFLKSNMEVPEELLNGYHKLFQEFSLFKG